MKKIKILAALVLMVTIPFVPVVSYDMSNVYAYPVPFNPHKDTLKITNPGTYSMEISIYDINGDIVCTKSGSAAEVIWNGRDESGRYVKPGLYIIKVIVENTSGDYGKKIIRILVDY